MQDSLHSNADRSPVNIQLVVAQPEFDQAICHIIETVGAEFGAVGEGFGPSDPEVKGMSQHYQLALRGQYLVALLNDQVVGGCGIAPFNDKQDICELRKLFLLPEGRGYGIGRQLLDESIAFARAQGFQQCYLDTKSNMTAAIALYESYGFKRLNQALEGAVHCGCDIYMLLDL